MAQTKQIKVHVQGDARPFSLARIIPVAVVNYRDLEPLVAPLELETHRERWLVDQLRQIMSRYLAPLVLAEKLADHAKTLKLLEHIAVGSDRLATELSQLNNDVLCAIEDNRTEPREEVVPPPFDILQLTRQLTRLSHAVERVGAPLQANRRGRPAQMWREKHVEKLLDLLDECELEVAPKNSGSGPPPRRRIEGKGGELLVALFQTFDPNSMTNLWGAIDRVRRKAASQELNR